MKRNVKKNNTKMQREALRKTIMQGVKRNIKCEEE
jgi:hypothetical protein